VSRGHAIPQVSQPNNAVDTMYQRILGKRPHRERIATSLWQWPAATILSRCRSRA